MFISSLKFQIHQYSLTFIALLGYLFITSCGGTSPNGSLEPLPYPNQSPTFTVPVYYLDADSQVSFEPKLILRQSGMNDQGQYVMEIQISITGENNSTQSYTIETDRQTVYNLDTGIEVGTTGLDPLGITTDNQTVPSSSNFDLKYTNNPLDDDLIYSLEETQFFSVFALKINGKQQVFCTQAAIPG